MPAKGHKVASKKGQIDFSKLQESISSALKENQSAGSAGGQKKAKQSSFTKMQESLKSALNEKGEFIYDAPAKAEEDSSLEKKGIFRIRTGIEGMDQLISGGIPADASILVAGGSGSGKSIFSLQLLANGIRQFDEPGLYITFEEEPDSIRETGNMFGWDIKKLEDQNKLRIMFKDPYEIKDFTKTLSGEIYYTIKEMGIQRVVVDSITYLTSTIESPFEVRRTVASLTKRFKKLGITSFLLSEINEAELEGGNYGMEPFVVDGVFVLHNFLIKDMRQRAVEILKLRKTKHDTFLHPFKIGNQGIEVFPEEQVFKD